VNGLLVPPEDVTALAGAMRAMWEDAERRRSMGSRALRTAERFSLDRIVDEWEHKVLAR
jgi:glycosyltransferase involved in cell wall biosynthesis